MTSTELKNIWRDNLGPADAFETMESNGITYDTVKEVLGAAVADEYSTWIYQNVK